MDIYPKQFKCPICGNLFISPMVKSTSISVDKRDTDFCTYYKGINPLFYDVVVCNACGYGAKISSFDNISSKDIESIKKNIVSKWKKRDLPYERSVEDAIMLYKIVLINISSKFKPNKYEIAGILLRIAWLYRYQNDNEKEKEFLALALQNYLEAFQHSGSYDNELDVITVMYLIAELNRRLGDYNEARKWFSKIISNKQAKQNPHILEMAREQIQLIKEEYKNEV